MNTKTDELRALQDSVIQAAFDRWRKTEYPYAHPIQDLPAFHAGYLAALAPHSGGEVLLERPARVAGRDFMPGQPVQQLVGRAEAHYNVHYSGATDPRLATPTPQAAGARLTAAEAAPSSTLRMTVGTTAGQQAAGVSEETALAMLRECYEWLFESKSDGPRVSEGALINGSYTRAFHALHERLTNTIAALTAAGAAPEGFVLVPREPTEAMLDEMRDECLQDGDNVYPSTVRRAYAAMLAAAQQPGAQHGQEGQ